MRHYEIVFLVHPDQSDQTNTIISKLSSVVSESGGTVHRSENIGNRKLAYPIQDQFKASYGLLNIECDQATIDEIKTSFKFNDSIIRNLNERKISMKLLLCSIKLKKIVKKKATNKRSKESTKRKKLLYFMKMFETAIVNEKAEKAEKERKAEERRSSSGGKNFTHNVTG